MNQPASPSCEVVAVGTELLLGQIVDTNSSYIGEQLALSGIDSHFQTKVGDNFERMRDTIALAAGRNDFVVVCGGLGPTQDDITRDCIAAVMGADLVRQDDLIEQISSVFKGRPMEENNLRQADLPAGAKPIPVLPGTAPGFVCEMDGSVLYAVPGVPWEMKEMMEWVLADMRRCAGFEGAIKSRVIRTWGESESGLATLLAEEVERLDAQARQNAEETQGTATIAFLASGWDGLKIRLTAKADSDEAAEEILSAEEERVREILPERLIYGTDEETMESVVLDLLRDRGLTLGLAESLTGGLIGARLTAISGSSAVFLGDVVSYAKEVKFNVLGVPEGPVVSEDTVAAMAEGACRVLGADCGLAVTGVAGPEPLEGVKPGVVWIATTIKGKLATQEINFPFDRERTRQFTVITALNSLRLRLLNE